MCGLQRHRVVQIENVDRVLVTHNLPKESLDLKEITGTANGRRACVEGWHAWRSQIAVLPQRPMLQSMLEYGDLQHWYVRPNHPNRVSLQYRLVDWSPKLEQLDILAQQYETFHRYFFSTQQSAYSTHTVSILLQSLQVPCFYPCTSRAVYQHRYSYSACICG